MPWKHSSVMDERLQFVARRLGRRVDGRTCREFGISRKTGYKIFERYPGRRSSGVNRPEPTSLSVCRSTSLSGRETTSSTWELYACRQIAASLGYRSFRSIQPEHRRDRSARRKTHEIL